MPELPAVSDASDQAPWMAALAEQQRTIERLMARIEVLEARDVGSQNSTRGPAGGLQFNRSNASPGVSQASGEVSSPASVAGDKYTAKKAKLSEVPCRFGNNCTREKCWFQHPNSEQIGSSSRETSKPSAPNKPVYPSHSQKPCHSGLECTRTNCRFAHPAGWDPSGASSEPPFQQEANTWDHSENDNNEWDNGANLSSWADTSNNTWGNTTYSEWGPTPDNTWGTTESQASGDPTQSEPTNSEWAPNSNGGGSVTSQRSATSKSNPSPRRQRGAGRQGRERSQKTEQIATETTTTPEERPSGQSTPTLPSQSFDQTSVPNESADVIATPVEALDVQDTPPLEPSTSPSMSSPSGSATPETPDRLVWSDEPVTIIDFSDTPSDDHLASESPAHQPYDTLASGPTAGGEGGDDSEATEAQPSLDNTPSAIYSSWDNVQPSASDWGFDMSELTTPPEADKKPESRKKSGSKSKGKQKALEETKSAFGFQPGGIGAPGSAKPTPEADPKPPTPSTPSTPSTLPLPNTPADPPQGVPEDEIPDWLLGVGEDPLEALGISRAPTPEPSGSSGPSRLAPSQPAGPPRISQMSGDKFPALGQAIPIIQQPAKASTAAKPTIRARATGWKIIPSSDTPNAEGSNKNNNSKPRGGSGKNAKGKK